MGPSTVKQAAEIQRSTMRNVENWTDEQLATAYYSQVAACSGCSFSTWRISHDLPDDLEAVAKDGFLDFSDGMVGVE
jgi:hypothetical protein